MTDHATLISELRERAEWARAELNQAAAECFEKAADALEEVTKPAAPRRSKRRVIVVPL